MKYYGIFNQNDSYKLLRYSNAPQESRTYQEFNFPTKTYSTVVEVCLPDIDYSIDNIGKTYDPDTGTYVD
jgi:hypothetical protein